MKSSISLILILFAFMAGDLYSQDLSRARINLKPRQIHKLPKVDLDLIEKTYPQSYLYRVKRNSIVLINRTYHRTTHDANYFQGEINFDEINTITVHSRKRKFKTNLWGALIGGTVGYLVGKSVAKEDFKQISIELLNQQPTTGFIEPILGTIVGASIGVAIGDLFTPITIEDVHKRPRQTSIFLRGITNKKKSRRK